MKDINLLQGYKNEKKDFDINKNGRSAFIVIGVLIIVIAVAYGGLLYANDFVAGQTEALQAEADSYAEVQMVKTSIDQKNAEIQSIHDLLDTAEKTSYADTGFFKTVSSALNKNIFLTNLAVQETGSVNISGTAVTRQDITYFMYALKKTSLFSDVSVNVINLQSSGDTGVSGVYDFTITAAIKAGGGEDE